MGVSGGGGFIFSPSASVILSLWRYQAGGPRGSTLLLPATRDGPASFLELGSLGSLGFSGNTSICVCERERKTDRQMLLLLLTMGKDELGDPSPAWRPVSAATLCLGRMVPGDPRLHVPRAV